MVHKCYRKLLEPNSDRVGTTTSYRTLPNFASVAGHQYQIITFQENQDLIHPFKMPPRYLYKILDEAPPSPIPPTLPLSDLDKHDGFIHLSTAAQAAQTARLFFANHDQLWILKLESKAIDGRIDYSTDPKAGVEDGCAHVHESQFGLGRDNIVETIEARRSVDQAWTDADGMKGLSDS